MRAKRGVALPVVETPAPSASDMPPEEVEPEGLEEVVAETGTEPEEPAAEEAAPEPEAEAEAHSEAEAEAEPVAEK